MHRTEQFSTARSQSGAGLIEVLIAVLVMGIGMLGIAAMQATALRNSSSALERSQAVIQSYAILDAMRANRVNAVAGAYNQALNCTVPAAAPASLAESDLQFWLQSMKDTLGNNAATCGQIGCNGSVNGPICTVIVQWDDSRAKDGRDTAGNAANTVTTVTTL